MSSGTDSGIFCVASGTETGDSTIDEMLGKGVLPVAVAIHANSTWLVSGATVILNFLRNQCPEWDLPLRLAKI
jgi:hypothetical protein